ncbi:hypothetical protein AVEN_177231-1 [Araneus ventricosus]|uniref:Uncharacterized protein n=1 Tax=Araneus ventricosus TaxID=182803 RepID=A0A4Y2KY84_ARAVE|nr:hypothetical protein AVEN_177231-1 [Araneus ventricosus]
MYTNKIPLLAFNVITISYNTLLTSVVQLLETVSKRIFRYRSKHRCHTLLDLRNVGKAQTFQVSFEAGKQEVWRCQIWRIWRVFKNCHLASSEELPHTDGSVQTGVVVQQFPLTTLVQLGPNPPDAFQQLVADWV